MYFQYFTPILKIFQIVPLRALKGNVIALHLRTFYLLFKNLKIRPEPLFQKFLQIAPLRPTL